MRNKRTRPVVIGLTIVMIIILLSAMGVKAEYTYMKPGLQILDQRKRSEWGTCWCAPTSAAISLSWFGENGYPELLPDYDSDGDKDINDKYELANRLGRDYMSTTPSGGTFISNKVNGIKNYINNSGYGDYFDVVHCTGGGSPLPFAAYRHDLENFDEVLVGTPSHVMVGWAVNHSQNPDGTYNVGFVDPWDVVRYNTTMSFDGWFTYGGQTTYLYDMVVISAILPGVSGIPIYPGYAVNTLNHTYVIHGEGWEHNEVYVENGVVHGIPYGTVYNTTGTVYALANGTALIVDGTYFPVTGSVYLVDGTHSQPTTVPVGGIYIPVNKLELLAPYIRLTVLLAVAVITLVYFKVKKKKQ